jgi:hypothetical protein
MADVSLLHRLLQVPGARELRVAVIGGRAGEEEPEDEPGPVERPEPFKVHSALSIDVFRATVRIVAIAALA